MSNQADHRIFGHDASGSVRVNLYHGAGHPYAGVFYSWVTGKSSGHLAYKLEHQWEQALSPEEWDAIDELEANGQLPCEDCAGQGYDIGGIGRDPEPCPACKGSGIEPALVTARRAIGIAPARAGRDAA